MAEEAVGGFVSELIKLGAAFQTLRGVELGTGVVRGVTVEPIEGAELVEMLGELEVEVPDV